MSANILIMGDSWGVPSYPPKNFINSRIQYLKSLNPSVEIEFNHLGDPPHTHLEFLLKKEGYSVINTAKSGSSNLEAILRAKDYFNDVDTIIWFHTESLRDFKDINKPFKVEDITTQYAIQSYQEFEKITKDLNCKKIVIGGQAPVIVEEFNKYVSNVDLLIENWHSEILNKTIPFTHALCHINLIGHKHCINTHEEKMQILNNVEFILNLDELSTDFPDNAHPGRIPHKNLFEKIQNIIN